MHIASRLLRGRLIKRYKRFLADIRLEDGREITAHCANPGSMIGVAIAGAPVWVSVHDNKKRKLPFSWEFVLVDKTLIPINTTNPNKIAQEAVSAGLIPELTGYETIRREVKYGAGSRIDLLLEGGRRQAACFVEIKNVHLSRTPGIAEFPDCVTKRGTKHLGELERERQNGSRAVMLFIVQRTDCASFSPAGDLDPVYAAALKSAVQAGVEILCYDCNINLQEITLRKPLPINLDRQ